MLLCALEILPVSCVDRSQKGKTDIFPHFLHLEQSNNILLFIFELLNKLFSDEGFELLQSLITELRH
jgi:hypothetical protein